MDDEPVPEAELFLDDRGSLLRVRWERDAASVTLSIWRAGRCVATHHLDSADQTRLSSLLTQAWVDSVRQSLSEPK